MAGGKSGGQKLQVTDYYMSIHYGVCAGPIDEIHSLRLGDKDVPFEVDGSEVKFLNLPELFGGPKQAGGVRGNVHVLFGDQDQVMPSFLASKVGRTPSTMPAFRGLFTLFFTGVSNFILPGFVWGSQNPMLPAIEVDCTRMPRGLLGDPSILGDANPSHMIYEIVTNTDWGRGLPPSRIDIPSLLEGAEVLRNEGLGLSFVWTRQMRVEELVQEVCAHIDGYFFDDPVIGKHRLKLVRNDYDIDALPVIDPSVGEMVRFDRPAWGSTTNEIQVQWTNPESEQIETVVVQDIANIGIQRSISTDTKNYNMVRRQSLAIALGQRDLQSQSAPMMRAEMKLHRRFWNLNPGDPVVLRWPTENVDRVVFRVVKIRRPRGSDEAVGVNLVQDVFSSPYYVPADAPGQWANPNLLPRPIKSAFVDAAPYYLVAAKLGDSVAQGLVYPETFVMALIEHTEGDNRYVDFKTEETDATGDNVYMERGSFDPQDKIGINAALLKEITTTLPLADIEGTNVPIEQSMFIVLHDPDDPLINETALVMSVDSTNVVLRRGVLDTIPRAWPNGTSAWIVRPSSRILDPIPRPVGTVEKYIFLPVTSLGRLTDAEAGVTEITPSDRMHRPYRPTHPRIGSNAGPVVGVSAGATNFTLNWYRRNRLTETGVVLKFDDIDVTPEAGQTTTIEVKNSGGSTVVSYTGETGTSKVIPLSALGSPSAGATFTILLSSVRSGFVSLNKSEIGVLIIA